MGEQITTSSKFRGHRCNLVLTLKILTGSLSQIASSVIVSPCPGIRAPHILMRLEKEEGIKVNNLCK
jgi:hypothetical protein